MTSTSVSAVGNIIPDTNDVQIQTDFVMNQSEEISRYRDYICDTVDIEKDIIFASKKDYQNNNIDLALDLYQPFADSEESRPIIIFAHGGGMYTGSKDSEWDITVELAEDFAMKGYVCVAIDYRLNPEWEETGAFTETMKNASEDVASAVEWVRENADKYKINPDCIALAGYSSGAEIIDNMYFSNYLVDERNFDKSGINAVISISGNRLFYDNSACSGDEKTKCLILHGDSDDINPLSDAEKFLEQLGEKGEIKTLSGNNHFWTETDEQKNFLKENISDFLLENMFSEYPSEYNFAKALQYSLYFYDEQMCGEGVESLTDIPWRANCHLQDGKYALEKTNLSESFINENKSILDPDNDNCIDLGGGYHDAGDHVKMGLPASQTASVLGWSFYEFENSFKNTEQAEHYFKLMKYFCEYFMKCTIRNESGETIAFCYQVGDGDFDNDSWMPPELQDISIKRSAYFFTDKDKGTDIKAETSASLAVNAYNFRNYDKEFSDKCLSYSESLYEFAVNSPLGTTLSDGYYTSSSYYDDLTWAALWLYINTGEQKYLDDAEKYIKYYSSSQNNFDWNNMWIAARCLYAEVTNDSDSWNQIKNTLDICMTKYNTPQGYAFFSYWGSARHNCNAQIIALIYDKYNSSSVYSEWAKGQMEYLMGKNSLNRCYITGFNENSVKYPHHRGASGLAIDVDENTHRHTLVGALAGGPDENDNHNDSTGDYVQNEVALDYNAGLVGALAGLYSFYGQNQNTDKNFSFEEEVKPDEYYTVVKCTEDNNNHTTLRLYLGCITGMPKRTENVSIRYYFDISELSSIDKVYCNLDYDGSGYVTVSNPVHVYENIYYYELSWNEYSVPVGAPRIIFTVGSESGWDSSNDFSFSELNQNFVTAPNIPVYISNSLVGGSEPILSGDSNNDGNVDISDAVAVASYIINPEKNPLSAQGIINADVHNSGNGLNANDALAIQQYLAGIISILVR
ncbi:MAG: glycoside hydrolase family 9 protein [Ruminococcus sp.]